LNTNGREEKKAPVQQSRFTARGNRTHPLGEWRQKGKGKKARYRAAGIAPAQRLGYTVKKKKRKGKEVGSKRLFI
jgi:hypothetical protein